MIDDKKYDSFVIGVARNHNNKITTVVVGNKIKNQPATVLNAFAGEDAQMVYNLLCGRMQIKKLKDDLI